jgi:AAA+ ATPase superfamily predicted ATPase
MILFSDMKNPFQFGRELGIGSLVDRKKELAAVEQAIRDGNKLFLIGPRRFGKTSILRTATDRLKANSAIVVRLDAESFPTIDLLVAGIVSSAAKALNGEVKRVGELIQKIFSMLRPELDYSVTDGEWSVKFGVKASKLENPVLLVDALNGFEKLAKAQPESIAIGLIIDEFQRIIEIGGREIEGQIRSAIQTHSRVGYVFAGSKTRMLNDMVMEPTRPFYRLGTNLFLGPVPRVDFTRFLKEKFAASGITAEDAAISHLLDLAEDVPFNVQMLAHNCWTRLRDEGRAKVPTLTLSFVDETLKIVVLQQDPFYAQLWVSLTAIQQRTLMVVVAENGLNLQSARVAQAVGKGAGTVRKALMSMRESSILREDQSVKQANFRFEDPFFGRWIKLTAGF